MTCKFKSPENAMYAGVKRLSDLGLPVEAVDNDTMKFALSNRGVIIIDTMRHRIMTVDDYTPCSTVIDLLFKK